MMKSAMFAFMMGMMAMTASATTSSNAAIYVGRGEHRTTMVECHCKQCEKVRKQLDKHMRKHHLGRQNRMACRECMYYSQKLNAHMRYQNNGCNCASCNVHNGNHNSHFGGGNNNHNQNNGSNGHNGNVQFGRR